MKSLTNSKIITYIYLTAGLWTILILGLTLREVHHIHKETKEMAITEADTHFKKTHALRLWGASHGGLYVPVDETTPANKYLAEIPERDIRTPSGRNLTLMNPAYFIRQLGEQYEQLYGTIGHLTSLKLMRPENRADEWETKALKSFEQGALKSCLKCHAHQGYQVGDVRGGISISIPMTHYLTAERRIKVKQLSVFFILWITGMVIIRMGGKRLISSMKELNSANKKLLQHQHHLEAVVRKRTASLTRANQQLKHLARADGLTTIPNRRYFDEEVNKEWHRAMRHGGSIALIMVDIDYFKLFNDAHGHQAGDTCLKKVALALHSAMKRAGDFTARYGGEEFAAVLPNTDTAGAVTIAKLQGAADARRRACRRTHVLQMPANAAGAVPCERLLLFQQV